MHHQPGRSSATLDEPQVRFDISPYSLDLPSTVRFPDPSERARPHRVLPQFRLGPFDVNLRLMDDSLEHWREHVGWTTKYQGTVSSFEVNGIPGLRIPAGIQRMDYTFQVKGLKRIEIVAWSDTQTTADDRALIEELVLTLDIRLV
jgi:hypothetical protein